MVNETNNNQTAFLFKFLFQILQNCNRSNGYSLSGSCRGNCDILFLSRHLVVLRSCTFISLSNSIFLLLLSLFSYFPQNVCKKKTRSLPYLYVKGREEGKVRLGKTKLPKARIILSWDHHKARPETIQEQPTLF